MFETPIGIGEAGYRDFSFVVGVTTRRLISVSHV